MAPPTSSSVLVQPVSDPTAATQPPKVISSAKTLAESAALTSLPSDYSFTEDPYEPADPDDPHYTVPSIDFSLLTSSASPHLRSKTIHHLRQVCQEWGCFTVINHGVPENLMQDMVDAYYRFFNLTEEEKTDIETNYGADRAQIKYGTSYNVGSEKVRLWRDFIKMRVHPEFHTLHKPQGLRWSSFI